MLTLKCDRSRGTTGPASDRVPPKYILLLDNNCTTIGRGLKSDVRLLYPWLSRRHATVLNQGIYCYVQSHGQNAVYVNGERRAWQQLVDKDVITIGGARKGVEEGSGFPARPGPYIEYVYYKKRLPIADKENIYQSSGENDSFCLTEEVNGRLVEEVYCPEDFNETQDFIDLPEFLNIKEEPSEIEKEDPFKPLSVFSFSRPRRCSSRSSSRSKSGDSHLPGSQSESSQGSVEVGTNPADCQTAGSLKPCNSINEFSEHSRLQMTAKKGRKPRKASAAVSKAPVSGIVTSQTAAAGLGAGASQSTAKSSSVASTSGTTPSSSASPVADDAWERFDRTVRMADTLLSKLSEKSATVSDVTEEQSDAYASVDSDAVGCDFVSSMAKEEERENSTPLKFTKPKTSTKGKEKKERRDIPLKVKSAEPKKGSLCVDPATVISAGGETSAGGAGGAQDAGEPRAAGVSAKAPRRAIPKERPRREKKKIINYTYPDEESEDDLVRDDCLTPANQKAVKKSCFCRGTPCLDDDDDFLPDLNDVSIEETQEEELPDILNIVKSPAAAKIWGDLLKHESTKRKAKDEDWEESVAKRPRKGKAATKTSTVNKPISVQDKATIALIAKWERPFAEKVCPEFKEIARGMYFYDEVAFADAETFRVQFSNEAEQEAIQCGRYQLRSEMSLSADVANLKNKLLTGDMADGDYNKVFGLIQRVIPIPKMTDFDKPKLLPNDYTIVQPDQITLNLKQYQLNTLSWMLTVEGKVDRGWHTSRLVDWEESGMDLKFELSKKRVFIPPYPKTKDTILTVKSKGGILADQMGLGKTITLLALFAKNKPPEQRIPDPDTFRYQDECRLPSGATLVVAPSHLTGQWKDEIETHTRDLKVLLITTMPQIKKLTYLDMMLADVVIVSVQFLLTNKFYKEMPTGDEADSAFIKMMRKLGENPLLRKTPNLSHFLWWRIVADEAHELLRYDDKVTRRQGVACAASDGVQVLDRLQSRHRWYVTGTPFPHGEKSLRAALKFLEVEVDDKSLMYDDGSLKVDIFSPLSYPLHHVVRNHLYVRNTKTSIGIEYNVPEFVEELILLTMSEVERGVYDRSVSELERRKLCCHMQIAERIQSVAGVQQKSLEEVRLSLIEQAHKDIRTSEKMIEDLKSDIARNSRDYASEIQVNVRKILKARGERLKEGVKKQEEEIAKHRSAISYFDNIMPRIDHNADEPCVICLDTIDVLTVTPCGHLFCRKCIIPCIHAQHMCPTCRKPIKSEQHLIEVNDAKGRQELHKSTELRKLTEKYGTKMAFLIFYLRNLFQDDAQSKVIIFSQWDSLLHKIGETLNENDIKNVFVKGNVYVRNRAITSFRKQNKTRVIMLSLQNAASGTNLVEATHVILIDPVAGSKEEAIAVESQAIGRAHRMGQDKQISVVRMVMKDTIEHELYLRNNSEDIAQVEFDFEKSGTLGGPQIVRTTRKVPEPDPAVLRTALQKLEPDPLPTRGGRRRRWAWGWNRGSASQELDAVLDLTTHLTEDLGPYAVSDDEYSEDDGPADCTIA